VVPGGGEVDVVRGDILDREDLGRAAEGCEAIVHVAGLSADWAPDPGAFERVNVLGTRNVLGVARKRGVRRVLTTSTVMVLGPSDGLVAADEGTTRIPGTWALPYQTSKARSLALCRAARRDGLEVPVVFPGMVFGPGPLTSGNYLARIMSLLERGELGALPPRRGQRWCLVHRDDVARGHRLALEKGDPDGEYILGGDNLRLHRVLEVIRDGLALPALPLAMPGGVMRLALAASALKHASVGSRPPLALGTGKVMLHSWAFSSRRAQRELDYSWRPFTEAFPHFVSWYAARSRTGTGSAATG
jgi:farnesol dehydrogenase